MNLLFDGNIITVVKYFRRRLYLQCIMTWISYNLDIDISIWCHQGCHLDDRGVRNLGNEKCDDLGGYTKKTKFDFI